MPRSRSKPDAAEQGGLVPKNITILGGNRDGSDKRTSMRLEAEMWNALDDIAEREGMSVNRVCTMVSERLRAGSSLTAMIRVFIMSYYRAAATEEGHKAAGHGCGSPFTGLRMVTGLKTNASSNASRQPLPRSE